MMQISIFGDSILEGVYLSDGIYCRNTALIESFAQEQCVELNNHSAFGSTVTRGFRQLNRALKSGPLGTFSILEFGGNDCDHRWTQVVAHPNEPHLPATPEDEFQEKYKQLISKVRANNSVPIIATLPPISSQRYFDWICSRGLNPQILRDWLGNINVIGNYQAHYSQMAQNIAKETNCELLDLRSFFPSVSPALEEVLCQDGIHPNLLGQNLIYQAFSKFVSHHKTN